MGGVRIWDLAGPKNLEFREGSPLQFLRVEARQCVVFRVIVGTVLMAVPTPWSFSVP